MQNLFKDYIYCNFIIITLRKNNENVSGTKILFHTRSTNSKNGYLKSTVLINIKYWHQ